MDPMKNILVAAALSLTLGFPSGGGGHESAKGPSPDEALSWLQSGNRRFLAGTPLSTNLSLERRLDTAKAGQRPFATVLGCSDSRAPLESIFHVGVGDLFAVRVAGNVADTDEIGTVEYGVEHLGTPLLVVLGHSSCGAVTAVVKGAKVEGSIPALVSKIVPAVARAKKASTPDEAALIQASIRENVWQSISEILRRSPLTVELAKEGKLRIVGALYRIDTGEIEWMGNHPDEAKLLAAEGKEGKKEGHGGIPWLASLALAGVLFVWLTACFYLFVSDRRLLSRLKFRGRFFLALAGFAVAAAMMALVAVHQAASIGETGSGLAFLISPLSVLLLFAGIYTYSVRASLHRYIKEMREKWMEDSAANS
ncbi:MAG: carbonic anhydrase [Spirochaetes bacterium]|nr:carbonic anhydrase [Spirochaetota bacterium]